MRRFTATLDWLSGRLHKNFIMTNPKKYFHDRFVLFMLTVNSFLTVVTVASVLLRVGDTSDTFIQSYRSNLGLNAFTSGDAGQIFSFAVFAVLILVGQLFISMRLHAIRKHVSWIIMLLAMLLLIMTLIISNALLQLR